MQNRAYLRVHTRTHTLTLTHMKAIIIVGKFVHKHARHARERFVLVGPVELWCMSLLVLRVLFDLADKHRSPRTRPQTIVHIALGKFEQTEHEKW